VGGARTHHAIATFPTQTLPTSFADNGLCVCVPYPYDKPTSTLHTSPTCVAEIAVTGKSQRQRAFAWLSAVATGNPALVVYLATMGVLDNSARPSAKDTLQVLFHSPCTAMYDTLVKLGLIPHDPAAHLAVCPPSSADWTQFLSDMIPPPQAPPPVISLYCDETLDSEAGQ
jgi:hypothetical protein